MPTPPPDSPSSPPPPEQGPIVTLPPPAEFVAAAADLGIEFEPTDVERLGLFLQLLLEANRITNLTAITDPAQAWMKHIFDALTLVPVIASHGAAQAAGEASDDQTPAPDPAAAPPARAAPARGPSIIDIGSGGGVPAIPLAIVMPDVRFTLVEATGKKVEFLRDAIARLKLPNCRVLQGRAETLGQEHKTHRESYDLSTARALGRLAVVVELCGPLVKPGGLVIAVKGAKAEEELAEAKTALGAIGLRHVETIPTPTGRLVVLEKTIRTPRLYPRRDGEPARRPLGVTDADARRIP